MKILPLLGRRFQVDFIQARPPVAPLAWGCLAAGVLSLAAALADLAPRLALREQLAVRQAELRARLDRLPASVRSTAGADVIGLTQARSVLDELDRPWEALFDQLEAARAPEVHLVQLGVDLPFQTVQVVAEAPSLERLLQYSQTLAGNGPVQSVRLTHHEWRNVSVGRVVVASLTAELGPVTMTGKGMR